MTYLCYSLGALFFHIYGAKKNLRKRIGGDNRSNKASMISTTSGIPIPVINSKGIVCIFISWGKIILYKVHSTRACFNASCRYVLLFLRSDLSQFLCGSARRFI